MLALISALLFFLIGAGVLEDSGDIRWAFIAFAIFVLHFAVDWAVPRYGSKA
jgi:hypothetical protein